MAIQRMEHVGIVVDDLAAATEFFVELGLELEAEVPVEGRWVDRIVGLENVRADIAILQTPDGHGRLELTKFHAPSSPGGDGNAPANTPQSRTSTPSSPGCDPEALSWSANWSAIRTVTGFAMSAAPRGSSSNWQNASAEGARSAAAWVKRSGVASSGRRACRSGC